MRVVLLEVIRKAEGDDRKAGVVVGASLALHIWLFVLLVDVITLLAVDVADLWNS